MSAADEELEDGSADSSNGEMGSEEKASKGWAGPKFWRLLRNSAKTDTQVEPQHYLAAIAELLALTIFLSWFITWSYGKFAYYCEKGACGIPDFNFGPAKTRLQDNPIRNMVGYNNPCAFWDQPPALYFAGMMFCPMVYFAFRYAITDSLRAKLDAESKRESLGPYAAWCLGINWTYAASQVLVMGIFVITPHVYGDYWPLDATPTTEELEMMHWRMRAHSACFLQLVPILCLTMSANYFEAWMNGVEMAWTRWAVLAFYITATILETIFATTAIFMYEGDYSQKVGFEKNFVWNPTFMQAIDYTWFLSLPLAASFQPPSPDININITLVPEENDVKEGDDEDGDYLIGDES